MQLRECSMTDQTPQDVTALLPALQNLLQQTQAQATQTPAASVWARPAATAAPADIQGIAVPISIDTPVGKVRCYLSFPASAASSPMAIMSLLESLANMGYPLDAWEPRNNSGWNRGGNSGWSGNRGGNGGWRR
jgi:hypothetical protein